MKICPNCGGHLYEDAWDTVTEKEDGSFLVDAFQANVCEEECGYVERLGANDAEKKVPNLFRYATSELS